MRVIIISLKRSTERRRRVARELADTGLEFSFFDATDSTHDNFQHADRANPALTRKRKGYCLTSGELACYSSHLRAWKYCMEVGEQLLVLEDNVELSNTLSAKNIQKLIASVPSLEYVKLSGALSKRRFRHCSSLSEKHNLVRHTKFTSGASAYLISPEGANKLSSGAVEFLEPVDDYMEKPWRHQVIAYSVYPFVFQRAKIESTIGSDRKKKDKSSASSKWYREIYRIYELIMYRIYLYR